MLRISAADRRTALVVWRPDTVSDDAGGRLVEFVEVGSVDAYVPQGAEAPAVVAGKSGATHTGPVYLAPDANVRRGDELRGGCLVYRVLATMTPSEPVYLRADCLRFEHEPPFGVGP